MRPVTVVVLDVLVDDGFEMASADDEHPVEALATYRPHKVLGKRIGTRGPDRSTDGPDAFGTEDLVEA